MQITWRGAVRHSAIRLIKGLMFAALVLLDAVPALAAKGDNWGGLQFGGSFPTGDFNRYHEIGWEGGFVWTHMVSEQAGLGVDLAYHAWRGTPYGTLVVNENALQATAEALYHSPSDWKARPYAKGGGGLYSVKLNGQCLGFNVGTGVNLRVGSRYEIGVGGMYHVILTQQPTTTFVTAGVNLWGTGTK